MQFFNTKSLKKDKKGKKKHKIRKEKSLLDFLEQGLICKLFTSKVIYYLTCAPAALNVPLAVSITS